jgi:hypothetical protein
MVGGLIAKNCSTKFERRIMLITSRFQIDDRENKNG